MAKRSYVPVFVAAPEHRASREYLDVLVGVSRDRVAGCPLPVQLLCLDLVTEILFLSDLDVEEVVIGVDLASDGALEADLVAALRTLGVRAIQRVRLRDEVALAWNAFVRDVELTDEEMSR